MRLRHLLAFCLAVLAVPEPADAQLALPGATSPAVTQAPSASPAKRRARSASAPHSGPARAPGEETVIERSLLRNGAHGRLELARRDKDLAVTKLTLAGDQISRPGEACRVDVVSGEPIIATAVGRDRGLSRYKVDLPACAFSFDVLDGAVLVEGAGVCEFKSADCRIDVTGVWGPPASVFTPERVKAIEKSRAQHEQALRANYKALVARAPDKNAVKLIAREQAGFSSQREMICRDYAMEVKHGFCASRITEARAVALAAELGGAAPPPADHAKAQAKKKPRPKPSPSTPTLPPAY